MATERPKSPPRTEFRATRFDSHGRDIERCKVNISYHIGSVYIHVEGEKISKSYNVSRTEWDRAMKELNAAEG